MNNMVNTSVILLYHLTSNCPYARSSCINTDWEWRIYRQSEELSDKKEQHLYTLSGARKVMIQVVQVYGLHSGQALLLCNKLLLRSWKKKKKKIPTLVHMNGIKEKRKKEKWLKSEIEEYQQSKMVERRNRRKTSELEKSIYHRCKQNNKIFG